MKTPHTPIALIPVEGSSQIAALGHSGDTLAVKFKGGGATYHYKGVSADEFAQLKAAQSLGSHLHLHIKSRIQGIRIEQ